MIQGEDEDMDHKVVTIKDIAEMCEVSPATVSNVLNGKTKKVSQDVADRIHEAVMTTGYVPNYFAKSLRASLTKTIGIIAEDLIEFSVPPIIEGVMNCCEERDYSVLIENMRLFGRWQGASIYNEELFRSALHPVLTKMDASHVDGILYIGGYEHVVHNLKSSNHLPIVMAYSMADDENITSYRLDDFFGGYESFQYLLSKGHKKIGLIAGELNNNHTINRVRGVQKAMYEAGMLFDPELVEYQHWTRQGGFDGMKVLINKQVTAVFCLSDMIAAGAYAYLNSVGLKPGQDVAVMGYDNQDIARFIDPQITTMALPLEEIGYQSASRLLELIEQPEKIFKTGDVLLKGKIIERNSVYTING